MADKPQKGIGGIELDDESDVSPELVQRYKDKFYKVHPRDANRYTKEAIDWFRVRVSKDLNVKASQLLNATEYKKENAEKGHLLIGRLYLFKYEAETAGDAELDVYDQYPLIFLFNSSKSKEGKLLLHGLNVHYLTPRERMMLFIELLKLKSSKRFNARTKLKLQWNLIKSVVKSELYTRAVHAYRVDRIHSRMQQIAATDWEIVVFLQLQNWLKPKTNAKTTASNIRKQIRKQAQRHEMRTRNRRNQ